MKADNSGFVIGFMMGLRDPYQSSRFVSYPPTDAMDDDSTPPPPANDAPAPPPISSTSGSPADFLKGVVGKRVVVRLTSGVDYRGAFSHRLFPTTQI
jgi:hypothetical protein